MSRVIVVGCGPTGACAAIMLAQRGISVLVLERWPEPYPLPRAVHFDDEVYRILAGLGLDERLGDICRPAPGMQLVDRSLRVLAEFRRAGQGGAHGYPQANMFDQPDLEALLRARMADLDLIELRTGADVVGVEALPGAARVTVRDVATGRDDALEAAAVLACDGANSSIRTMIGSRLDDLGFEQQWMVVDVVSDTELDVYDGVQQVCDHDRAATFMMVTPGRYRWEFRLRTGESAEEIDDAEVLHRIRPWLGEIDDTSLEVVRRAWYTFRGAVADHWSTGRVFLLGDAAHLTPPFIGQGMCAGVRDAANLSWKLALVLNGTADDRLLTSYQTERRAHVRQVIRLAIAIGWCMTGGSAVASRLRLSMLRVVSRLPLIQAKVADVAMPTLANSPLLAVGDRAAGRLCPQPTVRSAGRAVRFDELLGGNFAIVTSGRDETPCFDPDTRSFFDAIGLTVVSDAAAAEFDPDGTISAFLREADARALLVRPDRCVAAASDRVDLRSWRDLLECAGITGGHRVAA